jgi:hypothetical protein
VTVAFTIAPVTVGQKLRFRLEGISGWPVNTYTAGWACTSRDAHSTKVARMIKRAATFPILLGFENTLLMGPTPRVRGQVTWNMKRTLRCGLSLLGSSRLFSSIRFATAAGLHLRLQRKFFIVPSESMPERVSYGSDLLHQQPSVRWTRHLSMAPMKRSP